MTWLPTTVDVPSERDAVLGLHPEEYTRHRVFLEACAAAIDGIDGALDPDRLTPIDSGAVEKFIPQA